jgi:SNF2 family DNA or RNA helicase
MINAGNTEEAIKSLNCNIDTKDNIFQIIKKNIENAIFNKEKELECEKNKKVPNILVSESMRKIKSLEKSIETLKGKIKTIQEKAKQINEEYCPICLDNITKPTLLDCCGTTFCFECLALTNANKNKCPYCQNMVSKNSIHIIGDKSVCKNTVLKEKLEVLLEIIEKKPDSKILLFANYAETFNKIKSKLSSKNISNAVLSGTQKQIQDLIEEFKNSNIRVFMLNAKNFGAGLNLQMATDIIIYHRFTKEIEEQVIGRGQRLGRTTSLNVYYLIHDNEEKSFVDNKFEDVDYEKYLDQME